MENFDIIIYAVITVFLISRLWAVLGRTDEGGKARTRERPNPFMPKEKSLEDEENVMVLEGLSKEEAPSLLTKNGHAPDSLAGALDQVRMVDPAFNEKQFMDGAKSAFSKIVSCFASGDLTPVAWLLGTEVRYPFDQVIIERREKNYTLEHKLDRLVAADILSAKVEGTVITLAVEFVSHQINILKNVAGEIIEGKLGQAEEVRDVWVFRRDTRSVDPNWLLVETRS